MDPAQVTVTVDEEHVPSIAHVADDLRQHGMQVERVLVTLGVVTGRSTDLAALRAVPGVASVDPELSVQLPPPDQDVQ